MRLREFIVETPEMLDEVSMRPSTLKQMAAQTGAKAGIEFEMIVPNAETDDGDQEPDYDSDERVTDFDSIDEFFSNGDMNSSSDIRRLIEGLKEGYYDWAGEKRYEQWEGEKYDFFKDYFTLNEFDDDGAKEQAEEEIREANPELPEDSEEFQSAVKERVDEILDEQLEEAWDDQGRIYDRAREEWEQDADWPDEQDYLRYEGYRFMSDLPYNDYDVYWPYYTNGGEVSIEEIAQEFQDAIDRPVNFSSSYHGGAREENTYVVEPDSSLSGESGDGGLEFVSPPLPIDEMLSDFNKVIAWAKQKGCYTNQSTGLHMNVSVPNSSRENIDYVKLALLLGDRYVLEQFGRAANTYAKSAFNEVIRRIKQRPEDAQALLQQMKSGLGAQASKVIHSGITDKYISINAHGEYIEFRSPGGDWLNADWSKLENTLLRFVVALDAACDPQKFRQDYLKKLYQVLQPKSETDPIALFAKFSAGEMSKQELTQFIKQVQTQRNIAKDPTGGKKYWWNVQGESQRMEVVATNTQEAIATAVKEWGVHPESEFARMLRATPIRPYVEAPATNQQEPQQAGPMSHTYRVFTTDGNQTVGTFEAPGPRGSREAQVAYNSFLARMGRSISDAQGLFDYQEIGRVR